MGLSAGVLTVSDGCSRGERKDLSGEILAEGLRNAGYDVTGPVIVPDDLDRIEAALRAMCSADIALIMTTGGTGFAPRDVTPEATMRVIEREAPGLSEMLRWKGYHKFERAVLSRGVSGICDRTLIVNLPGSLGGVRDGLELLLPLAQHACAIIRDEPVDHTPTTASQVVSQKVTTAQPPPVVDVIETNIDDISPEIYEVLIQRLFEAGAVDVYITPIQMKKQRPAALLTVITDPKNRESVADVIFAETSSLGLRFATMNRITLERRWETVETRYGSIRVKIGSHRGNETTASPEYEDVKQAALQHGAPIKLVYAEAAAAWREKSGRAAPPH